MPNVPQAPGVPALSSYLAPTGLATFLLTADNLSFVNNPQQWGIFSGAAPVVTADTVVSFEFKKEFAISDYPVERGGFESFDKVYIPFDVRLRFVAGENTANRQGLLASIDAIVQDLNFYTAVTPDAVYPSINVIHYNYQRTSHNGARMIIADVWCREVRVQAGTTGSTASPGSSPAAVSGPVQPVDGSFGGGAPSPGSAPPPS